MSRATVIRVFLFLDFRCHGAVIVSTPQEALESKRMLTIFWFVASTKNVSVYQTLPELLCLAKLHLTLAVVNRGQEPNKQ